MSRILLWRQGLPTDPLSIQNGILVTQAARYPLLIDPQGQALNWIKNKEKTNMPLFGITALNNPQLKDQLEFCMQEGRSFVVAGVEEDIDPLLDPVLEKQVPGGGAAVGVLYALQWWCLSCGCVPLFRSSAPVMVPV